MEIEETIKNLLNSKKPNLCKIIMLTGSPGGGKTLCINHVLHKLEKDDYKVIALNSNMIKKKKDVQTILARELLGI
jgi:Cdc6-like AAA superfamily ATPase